METNSETTGTTAPAPKPTKTPKMVKKASGKKAAAKKAPAKKVAVGKQIAKATDGTALKTICAKLGIEPKLARRKLRAAKLDFHGHRERWTFNAKQADKVRELLGA